MVTAGEVTAFRTAEGRGLLAMQTVDTIGSANHTRIDTAAAALYPGIDVDGLADLDLSHTLPLGSPLGPPPDCRPAQEPQRMARPSASAQDEP